MKRGGQKEHCEQRKAISFRYCTNKFSFYPQDDGEQLCSDMFHSAVRIPGKTSLTYIFFNIKTTYYGLTAARVGSISVFLMITENPEVSIQGTICIKLIYRLHYNLLGLSLKLLYKWDFC